MKLNRRWMRLFRMYYSIIHLWSDATVEECTYSGNRLERKIARREMEKRERDPRFSMTPKEYRNAQHIAYKYYHNDLSGLSYEVRNNIIQDAKAGMDW